MKRLLFLLLICSFSSQAQQVTKEYAAIFPKTRELLYFGKFREALPLLHKLDSIDPGNANVSYLIGVCYVALSESLPEGIKRLEFSSSKVTTSYHSGQASEKNAPVYNWYYLGVGYSFVSECDKAEQCFNKFREFISDPGDSYVEDAAKKLQACRDSLKKEQATEAISKPADELAGISVRDHRDEKESMIVAVPAVEKEASPEVEPEAKAEKKEIRTAESRKNISTREVIYTTKSPLYAVQIGAFEKLLPANEFRNLKNVNSFIDKNGKIRYVVGHCVLRSQAENLRKTIRAAGYPDAFIVDINAEENFVKEVIHPDRKALGRKEYRVQLGVFRKEIPEELSKIYLTIEGVKETHEGDLTVLTSGSFKDHAQAKKYRDEMLTKGVPGAFVVVFINGKRQTPETASLY